MPEIYKPLQIIGPEFMNYKDWSDSLVIRIKAEVEKYVKTIVQSVALSLAYVMQRTCIWYRLYHELCKIRL